MYAQAAHILHESELFVFFVFHRKINILWLCPQALIKIKITASDNGVWKHFLFIALMTAASKPMLIIFGNQKEHHLFGRVNMQWHVDFFYIWVSVHQQIYNI